ncbi:DNA translocase FtsK [Listeria cossartiae subsp. cayugensis]|uniref:DNA translocase FtsK n=1 Tax=Listeria cossartiae subsp. cayugensis TaxID=2713505 RepID=A0ABU2IL60_9LIST|nr:DNA translocase FtsK [Listeria cossartiae]MDT0048180.1 DNA translocase FtsK [Listeria cossartiae subsp. cayugensis]MDT0064683.1 DNA translocase FtsK [Listeria cossartiae subsp. cayugensis]MDT0079713.1 DNA translocase FtsK [Listeria cossartiae subsp. cayugensis]MDT0082549.1 DNA translocase FtsK [Listeria cossartiae subsp. cayugensis]MDT0086916.1 DNA translocase FtsK [Listeria cossartiae subsp. cayugensis]
MGWFKDFFFGDMDEEIDTYEDTSSRKVEKQVKQRAPEVVPKSNVTAIKTKERTIRNERPVAYKTVPKQKPVQAVKRQMKTQMVYQYPKGEFRFPLIPDKQVSQPIQPKKQPIIERQVAEKPQPVKTETRKRPFTATDVPSPVYAFKKRPSKFEFAVSEAEELTEIQEDLTIAQVDLLESAEAETIALDVELDRQIEAEFPEEIEVVTEEEVVLEPEPIEAEPIPEIAEPEPKRVSLIKEEPVQATSSARNAQVESNRQEQMLKSRIPFNVMMVKKDKQALQKEDVHEVISEKPAIIEEQPSITEQTQPVTATYPTNYEFPSFGLLHPPVSKREDDSWLQMQQEMLDETLENFNVHASVVNRTQGPAVTRFEVQPEKGVKVSKITNLTDDIKLSLAAKDIRIEAPIPGKSTVGIEIPNQTSRPVMLSELMNTEAFQSSESPLTAALGLDISGTPIITDLQKMPHGLIAGATGSGKSVCINSLLVSLLYKATPDQLKLLLIDPKMVELAPYNRIPHLVSPVITDAKAATVALKWAVEEMERRYQLFSHTGVRNMEKYNEYASHPDHTGEKLPYILIVIDELADLMMVAPNDVEESISRIAQKARACGIHMIVATQRPSVDVITGLIKANIPTRVSFSVSSQIDSRTILDASGAEKLLGKGDMLFLPSGASKPVRLQGTFVSDEEIDAVVAHVRSQGEAEYIFEEQELLVKESVKENTDELFEEACDFVLSQNAASTSLLQRHFRIGYNRAARLMEALEDHQIVSGINGSKPRDVIITKDQLAKLRNKES